MKPFFFVLLLFYASLTTCYNQDDLACKKPFHNFVATHHEKLTNYEIMSKIFSSAGTTLDNLLSAIRNDITRCKRYIRKNIHHAIDQKILEQELKSFSSYVKKNKHCYNAINFHNELKERYARAFNNQKIVECIHKNPDLYGLRLKCKKKCKVYFDQIIIDLAKISNFEDNLHGDHIELKAINYVYKIELIKIRNIIYHNNVYKYERSYF